MNSPRLTWVVVVVGTGIDPSTVTVRGAGPCQPLVPAQPACRASPLAACTWSIGVLD
jgi:hypothetical protein